MIEVYIKLKGGYHFFASTLHSLSDTSLRFHISIITRLFNPQHGTLNPVAKAYCYTSQRDLSANSGLVIRSSPKLEDWHPCLEWVGLFGRRGNGAVVGIDVGESALKELVVLGKGGFH